LKLQSLHVRSLEIPFKSVFRHASAERAATQTLWVEAADADGTTGYGEGCPREYVTGESLGTTAAFCSAHERDWLHSICDLDSLREWGAAHVEELDSDPAAWCAVELALLDLLGRRETRSVESLLGLAELGGRFQYTAVLGDAQPAAFEAQLEHYLRAGFKVFKLKLSGDAARDAAKLRALGGAGVPGHAVRADANNLWRSADAAIAHLSGLDFRFCAIEEPVTAGDHAGMARLAAALDTRIVLDESVLRAGDLDRLEDVAGTWIVNVRVSKMGGLLRSLALLPELRRRGIGLIVGAQVGETSVLTRAALTVASAGRDMLIAQEGAFGTHLLVRDVVDRPLMFGAGGMLDAEAVMTRIGGLGLPVNVAPSDLVQR